jgi:streptomycin 6-kinase
VLAALLEEWELTLDGDRRTGVCSEVWPVRTADGSPAALKITLVPDPEGRHEHLALRRWDGNGAVRLLRADPSRRAMLLERLDSRDLTSVRDDIEACEITAAFYPRLHVPPMPQLLSLSSYVLGWADAMEQKGPESQLPRRMVEQAVAWAGELVADEAEVARVLHGDLHYMNVLAGAREPWLVIDPKPVNGDPHYEVAPLLWNRWPEVLAAASVRTAVRSRFEAVVDAAGLDEVRARRWVHIRVMNNALWALERPAPSTGTVVTTAIAIAKAVAD